MPESIKDKTVKGVGWSAIDSIAGNSVSFIIGIILARLLTPDDYGLIGIIAIFTAICNCFINAGFGSALIRKNDATEEDYNTVFVCNLTISIILYIILFFSAPLIAIFFSRQELTSLIRVSILGLIIGAFAIVQRTRLTKRIDFKSQTKVTIVSTFLRGIVGIYTAFIGWGVWALVSQEIVAGIVSTILLCFYNRWIPRFKFSMKSFQELFGFGSKLLVSGLLDTLWREMYQVIIGKCYTPATLGQYTRATMFSNLFSSNLTGIVQRVSYPVLSTIQDDIPRLKNGYKRIIKSSMFITFCSMLMLASVAKPMILVLIGEKWLQSATFLQIVCFSSMLYPLHAINLNMLQVQGRSDLFLSLEIVKKTIAIGPLVLGIFVNIYWMLWGSVIISFISYYLNAYYSGSFLNYSLKDQIKDIFPGFTIALLGATLAYLPVFFIDTFCNDMKWSTVAFYVLPLQLVTWTAAIILISEKVHLAEFLELKTIALSVIKRKSL